MINQEEMVKFFITQYFDGTLEIECKHMHYAFVDGLHFDNVPKEELFYRMVEIQERCEGLGIIPRFVII